MAKTNSKYNRDYYLEHRDDPEFVAKRRKYAREYYQKRKQENPEKHAELLKAARERRHKEWSEFKAFKEKQVGNP